MATASGKASIRGRQNKAAGAQFEQLIEAACKVYRQAGVAEIEKTPEAMKQLGHQNSSGQFLACYVKKAQPDFKGTLKSGQSVVFEAKFTSSGKIQQSVLLEQQAAALERHRRLGAKCFVLTSFDFKRFYKIPWEVWRDMKDRYGRKYIKPDDIPEYEVKIYCGMLDFLQEERNQQGGRNGE